MPGMRTSVIRMSGMSSVMLSRAAKALAQLAVSIMSRASQSTMVRMPSRMMASSSTSSSLYIVYILLV